MNDEKEKSLFLRDVFLSVAQEIAALSGVQTGKLEAITVKNADARKAGKLIAEKMVQEGSLHLSAFAAILRNHDGSQAHKNAKMFQLPKGIKLEHFYKRQGVYAGIWRLTDPLQDFDASFHCFIAPVDITRSSSYSSPPDNVFHDFEAVAKRVGGLRTWQGHAGYFAKSYQDLVNGLASGNAIGKWVIPPASVLGGSPSEPQLRRSSEPQEDRITIDDLVTTLTYDPSFYKKEGVFFESGFVKIARYVGLKESSDRLSIPLYQARTGLVSIQVPTKEHALFCRPCRFVPAPSV